MVDDELMGEFLAEPAELYDFLYKDSDRISSYYAQLFEGRLTSQERTDTSKKSRDLTGKGNVGVAALEGHTTNETQNAFKEVRDPHDMVTTDVLSYLATNNRLNSDPFTAQNGEIVIASGTILFADKSMIELGMTAYQSSLNKTPRDKASQEGIKFVKSFFEKTTVPSVFVLLNDTGSVVSGTLRDEGMQEPIPTYYYKHGGEGLDDVHVIGIKEARSRVREEGQSLGLLMQMSRPMATGLHDMILPAEGVRVTPIAIFRKIV